MGSERRTESAIVVRGVFAVITAILLIFLLVYATNRDVLTGGSGLPAEDSGREVTVTGEGRATEYGIQIGDNLKAFLYDNEFFDTPGEEPEPIVVTESEIVNVHLSADTEDAVIVLRVLDEEGRVVPGKRFAASLVRRSGANATTLTFTDDDEDGVIYSSRLSDGVWEASLIEQEGYRAGGEALRITLGQGEETREASSGAHAEEADTDLGDGEDDGTD